MLAALTGISMLGRAQAADAIPVGSTGGGSLQVIFGLLLVALLLAGSLYLLKRLAAPSGGTTLLRIISAAAVGARERVVVVEVGETWLVLGVAPGQVNKLHELPRQALPDGGRPAAPHQAFADRLRQIMAHQQRNVRNAP
ncbi:flagellar biosynthetic protein FliO [Sterolibacterium denitrificans]|uniref:flagellar biosynthetic protein FliO n=1 Tax=Sterolibacterium denitrificans TaxID=157592 RepID=UPI001F006A09|nr:flagellar biosynthetic protein FliO [Sterolibacterium denitrificans]